MTSIARRRGRRPRVRMGASILLRLPMLVSWMERTSESRRRVTNMQTQRADLTRKSRSGLEGYFGLSQIWTLPAGATGGRP